jgi:hypothetical protein
MTVDAEAGLASGFVNFKRVVSCGTPGERSPQIAHFQYISWPFSVSVET